MVGRHDTEAGLPDVVETVRIGLHWVGPDGVILWANPADYEFLGYRHDEYVGWNIRTFHAEGHVVDDILERLVAGERLQNYAARLRCKDGSTRQVLINSSGRFDGSGRFLHARCLTIDASDQRPDDLELQIEALSREVERLTVLASRDQSIVDAILTHSPHGIIVCDASGKLTMQNNAAETIWAGSATANTLEEWKKYRAFHPDGRPFAAGDWSMSRALMHKEIVSAEEVHFQRFDDSHGVLLGSSAPILDPGGEVQGALSVFIDITAFKRQEEELRITAQRYRTTLCSMSDAVIATDADGRITLLNPVAESLTGWSLDDAKGKVFTEVLQFVDGDTNQPIEDLLAEGSAGPTSDAARHTVMVARDTRRVVDLRVAPIRDDARRTDGAVLVFRDVTEQRREDERRRFLAEANALLVSSLDYTETLARIAELAVPSIADWCAIDLVDPSGSLTRVAVAHVDPDKVALAEQLAAKYPPDPHAAHGVHQAIRTGEPERIEDIPDSLLVRAAQSEEHLRLIRALGIRSSMVVPLQCRGRCLGAITFIGAESGRRFSAADLELGVELAHDAALAVDNALLYREARLANQAKDEFLAVVSHELRTPLHAILGWSSLLRTSPGLSDEKRAHALETIERNARAQAQLIDDLLDLSRIISGNLRLNVSTLDLAGVVEAAADALGPAAAARSVAIQIVIDDDARRLAADAGRLEQVVWNLLSNAIKFSDKGGSVRVRATRDASNANGAESVELTVSDDGIGIAPDLLPHVFDRFRQASASSTRSHGGLGLGLAIVKNLVELHGGGIEVESQGLGLGAVFRVRLPVSAVSERHDSGRLRRSDIISLPSLLGLTVLVVDDEPDARELMAELLRANGATVQTAESAAAALARVDAQRPDILVSDIGMPGEDGYSLIRRIRARGLSAATLPAAAVTAFARVEDRTAALLAGFQAHVAKPVDPNELVIVVATLAGRTIGSSPID